MAEITIFYEGEVVTRTEALSRGQKVYFTGVPCIHGHQAQRRTASRNCIPCSKVLVAVAHAKKPELVAAKAKRHRLKNPQKYYDRALIYKSKPEIKERMIEYRRNLYLKNKETMREASRAWNAKNAEHVKCQRHSRRILIRSSGSFTEQQFSALIVSQENRCNYCRCELDPSNIERDHILPVSRGGNNLIENIQALCRSCNRRKHNKTHEEYLAVLERQCDAGRRSKGAFAPQKNTE